MFGVGEFEPERSADGLGVLLQASEVSGDEQAPVSQLAQVPVDTGEEQGADEVSQGVAAEEVVKAATGAQQGDWPISEKLDKTKLAAAHKIVPGSSTRPRATSSLGGLRSLRNPPCSCSGRRCQLGLV